MHAFLLDLRLALRSLRRSPGFLAMAVLTLALGLGANTVVFSTLYGTLYRPLPYPEPQRLVTLKIQDGSREAWDSVSLPILRELRRESRCFEALGAARLVSRDLTGDGEPRRVDAMVLSSGYLEALGVPMALGSPFEASVEEVGGGRAVILGHAFWRSRYGGDPGVLGRSLVLDGKAHTIVGVAGRDLVLPGEEAGTRAQLLVPLSLDDASVREGANLSFRAVGRLRKGTTAAAANADLARLERGVGAILGTMGSGHALPTVADLHDELAGDRRASLLLLQGAALLLQLVAVANVAGLFLARHLGRFRDAALRGALGASLGQQASAFLAEGLLVGLLGGACAWALAAGLLALAPRFLAEGAGSVPPSLDGPSLAFAWALAAFSGLAVAVLPLVRVQRLDLAAVLREGDRGATAGRAWGRRLLTVAQVALATLLLGGGGLLLHSLVKVRTLDPGLRLEGLHQATLLLPASRYGNPEAEARFRAGLAERLRGLPGLASFGFSLRPAIGSRGGITPYAKDPAASLGDCPMTALDLAGGDYVRTLGLRLEAGRALGPEDRLGAPWTCMINASMAREAFPEGNAVGRDLYLRLSANGSPQPLRVVGVLADWRSTGLDVPPESRMVLSLDQIPLVTGVLRVHLRGAASPADLRRGLQGALRELDPDLPVPELRSAEALGARTLDNRTQLLALVSVFAGLALLLSGIGVYGVVAQAVAVRRREIGLRFALGASLAQVVGELQRSGMALILAGLGLGLVLTLALRHLLEGQLAELRASDPLALLGALLAMGLCGLLATLLPALRAARVPPAEALRAE